MKSRSTMRARIAAAALAAVMTVGMGMPAWAEYGQIITNGKVGSSEGSTFTYAGVKGGTTTFDKYLVINQPSYKATVPNVTFKEPGIYRWIITETAVNDVTGMIVEFSQE